MSDFELITVITGILTLVISFGALIALIYNVLKVVGEVGSLKKQIALRYQV